ncbi:MAG TPA: SRPBCC domain-containing protein [Candidatus Solibacter sp.]|nr:SRPBCC domain-containing protein [Candidatus Solibacter sp.]
MRKHEMEVEIAASPAQVWEAIATGQGITSWFCPIAEVEPGVGGKTYVKWCEGMEGTSRIEIWEPERRLQKVDDRPAPAEPSVIDYHIESRGGATVLRLVHSGFGDSANFDGEFESTGTAWPVFLQMLKHSAEQGVARCRNITIFRMLQQPSAAAWDRLMPLIADDLASGVQRHFNAKGHCCCIEFPARQSAMLGVFCESCGGSTMLTLMWLLYGASEQEADAVRERWTRMVESAFDLSSQSTA